MKKIVFVFLFFICFQTFCIADPNYTIKGPLEIEASSNNINFENKCNEFQKNFTKMSEIEKEWAFKDIYTLYLSNFKKFQNYYSENDLYIEPKQLHKYNQKFNSYGIAFSRIEDGIYPVIMYNSLINLSFVPNNWKEWLTLQQKYAQMRNERCQKEICEGDNLDINEIEQAITDLEKIENISNAIASIKSEDFEYIPDTSKRFLNIYLLGNELFPHFNFSNNQIYPSHKQSYEHFLENHKESKYYNLIKTYYEKTKQDNFKYNEQTREWLMNNFIQ